ncbi:MAG: hypothetical protein ABII27_07805 [bacterium]
MKKVFVIMSIALFIVGCSRDSNLFKFAHKSGSNSSVESLMNDAEIALQEKDYSSAINYYLQIIAKDPYNADALYGLSQAKFNSVLPIGEIIANFIQNDVALASPPTFSNMLYAAAGTTPHSINDSVLPPSVNAQSIIQVAQEIVVYLRRIINEGTHGRITSDNVDVLVNCAFVVLIDAVANAIDFNNNGIIGDSGDAVRIYNDFEYQLISSVVDASNKADLINRVDNVTAAINEAILYLDKAITKLNLKSNSVIAELKNDLLTDLQPSIDQLKAEILAL